MMRMKSTFTWILVGLVLGVGQRMSPAAGAKPLTLEEARAIALKQHPRISVADLQALAARQVVTQARSAYYPSVAFNATAAGTSQENTRIAAGGLNNPAIYEREADGLIFTQLITDFGRTSHLSKSAQFHARAAEQNAQATREQILVGVDVAFSSVIKAQAVLQVAQQTLDTRDLLFKQVSILASNKIKSELDVSFARVARGEARLLVAQAQNDLKAAFTTLSTLLGYRDEQDFQLVPGAMPTNSPPDAGSLVGTALAQRPDLERLRSEREAANQFAKAEKALRYPTLNAFGSGGLIPLRDPALQDDYAAAGINLNIPLFTGGLISARQREAELKARAAEENLRDAEDEVIRQVRVAGLNAQYAFDRLGLTQQLQLNAQKAYDLAQARYQNNSSSVVELSQAQLALTQAQIEHTSARYDYQIRRALLDYEIGATR